MDFSQNQGFNAQKAGGIGAVALAHVVLGTALVYCLHSTFITVEHGGQIIVKPMKPPIVKPIELPPPDESHPKHVEVYIPPVEIPNPPEPDISPIKKITVIEPPQETWKKTQIAMVEPGTGTSKPVVHSSSPVISNLEDCKPDYPNSARMEGDEGTVRLKLDIGANGQLIGANVVQSSGFAALDRAALRGLSRCAFKAATQDGTPVQSSLVTDYVWSLK